MKHRYATNTFGGETTVTIEHSSWMRDLTKGSITAHILVMAAPFAVSMLPHFAYQIVNLYFIARLGSAATAGMNAASNVIFIVSAVSQVLGVGTAALVAHATGRKDQADANLLFNQSVALSAACGVVTMALVYAFMRPYLRSVAADAATIEAGAAYMLWVLPGYVLTLPLTVMSSALRGTGVVQPTYAISAITVILNALLAPVLIAGWGTGVALDVRGAGLATSISTLIGTVALSMCLHRLQRYIAITPRLLRPKLAQWRRILGIGLPAGSELALMFFSTAVAYHAIQNFGASAQAGFGIGMRVLQVIVLPAMAVAFAAGPIAGQCFGARDHQRVMETFRSAAILGAMAMISTAMVVQWRPHSLVALFGDDPAAISVAAVFLQSMSWVFVAQGWIYTCTVMFQSLGNTVPSLLSSSVRFLVFTGPAMWLSTQPGFRIEDLWRLLMASTALQAAMSTWLLLIEFRKRAICRLPENPLAPGAP